MDLHVAREGKSIGVYPAGTLQELLDSGEVLPKDLVWHEGADQWQSASKFLAQQQQSIKAGKLTISTPPSQSSQSKPVPAATKSAPRKGARARARARGASNRMGNQVLHQGLAIVLWLVLAIVVFVVVRAVMPSKETVDKFRIESKGIQSITAPEGFGTADRHITGAGSGGSGNSSQATHLANMFAESMIDLQRAIRARAGGLPFVLSHQNMQTYCHQEQGRCAFLVQFNDLATFSEQTKDGLVDLTWLAAQTTLQKTRTGYSGLKLVVGIRGPDSYERAVEGEYSNLRTQGSPGMSRHETGSRAKTLLYPYFRP